jgi:hypothetical protein
VDRDLLLAARPRWRGQRGRLEVWYATLTDPDSGTGAWVHAELVVPTDPAREPYRHGWVALFPADAPPVVERFGPEPGAPTDGATWFRSEACTVGLGEIRGRTAEAQWELHWSDVTPPLFTFPRQAWSRELLPAAQTVIAPSATVTGTMSVGGHHLELQRAIGGLAHIYGHGSAERWAWLHADLGEGDVCEVVTAVSRRAGLRRLPPLAFVQLRLGGQTWPRSPAVVLTSRTHIERDRWEVTIKERGRRVRIEVQLPPERCVTLTYTDPDGATATCTNTERADATISLERGGPGPWELDQRWHLDGRAHAEIGSRP